MGTAVAAAAGVEAGAVVRWARAVCVACVAGLGVA